MSITRRALLGGSSVIALLGMALPVGARPIHGGAAASGGGGGLPALTAEITFPGGSPAGGPFTFDIATGTDVGSFVAPTAGFTQRCIRARNAGLANFFVDFRPDTSGGRVEVVFWNGETDPVGLTVTSGYTRDLVAYTCVIKNAGTTIATYNIPFHYWGCRWRYNPTPRTAIRTPAQVFSQNFLMSMSAAAARLTGYSGVIVPPNPPDIPSTNPVTGNPCWTPFDPPSVTTGSTTLAAPASAGATSVTLSAPLADTQCIIHLSNGTWQTFSPGGSTTLTLDKPLAASANNGATVYFASYDLSILINNDSGGNRPEEGVITEWQAEYLLKSTDVTRGPIAWNNMIQQAEMMGAQWEGHYLPDVQTNGPVNFRNDATRWASYTRRGGGTPYGSYYRIQGGPSNTVFNSSGGIAEHGANYFYIPYVLTEDPYYIEAMQYAHQDDKGYDIYGKENGIGHLGSDPTGASCICGTRGQWSYVAEPRNIGWGVRNTATAYATAQASPPSWMLPQSFYAEAGFNQAKLIDVLFTTSTNTFQTVFHNPCTADYLQLFETSYFLTALALANKVSLPTVSPPPYSTGSAPAWSTPLNFFFQQMTDVTAPGTTSATPISFTGSISGRVLAASSVTGTLQVGTTIAGAGIPSFVIITSLGTGTGGAGTYNLSASLSISSEAMTGSGLIGTSGWIIQSPQITNINNFAFNSVTNPIGHYHSYTEAWCGAEQPAAPSLSSVVGGALAGATYYVKVTYIDPKDGSLPAGETLPSSEASLAVSANHLLSVASPAQVNGVTSYNVYVGTSSGSEQLQNASPIAIGTNWTLPTSGLISGAAPPTQSTSGLHMYFNVNPTYPVPVYQGGSSSVQNASAMLGASGACKSESTTGAAAAFAYLNAMVDASFPAGYFDTNFEMRFGFDGT
jgi:hypothetical protein